jgi:hypothetical protein
MVSKILNLKENEKKLCGVFQDNKVTYSHVNLWRPLRTGCAEKQLKTILRKLRLKGCARQFAVMKDTKP